MNYESQPQLPYKEVIFLAQIRDLGLQAAKSLASFLDNSETSQLQQVVILGQKAEEKMILSNLPLIQSIAQKFQGCGPDIDDLIQEGYFGLREAAGKYNWRIGIQFSTYATHCIEGSILNAINKTGRLINIPRTSGLAASRLEKKERELQAELGREPTPDEVFNATSSGRRQTAKQFLQTSNSRHLSWEQLAEEENGQEATEWNDKSAFEQGMLESTQTPEETAKTIDYCLNSVFDRTTSHGEKLQRNKELFAAYLSGETNYAELGRQFGISREMVRIIIKKYLPEIKSLLF